MDKKEREKIHDITGRGRDLDAFHKEMMLKSGGGGGTYDGMEPRIKRLEDDMKEVKDGLQNVRERLARIEGQLADMPTKDWMNTRMLAYFGVTIAAIGAMIKLL